MVREIRVKDYTFTPITFNAAGGDATVYSDNPINGDILQVDWSFNRTGSVFITLSGTGEEVFRRNAPSGAAVQVSQPRVFSQSVSIGSIANADHVPFIANDKIILNVLNAASGTQTLNVRLSYR